LIVSYIVDKQKYTVCHHSN